MGDKISIMKEKDKNNLEDIDKLEKYLKEHEKSYKLCIKILAIRMVKKGETKKKIAEYFNVDRRTIWLWEKKYDEEGIEGLKPKYHNSGKKCKLTDKQIEELRLEIIKPENNYSIKDVKKNNKKRISCKILIQTSMGYS